MKTHLQPTVFFPLSSIHLSHVLFFFSAEITSFIASRHFGFWKASSVLRGRELEYRLVWNATAVCAKLFISRLIGNRDLCDSNSGLYLLGGTPLFLLGGNSYLHGDLTTPDTSSSIRDSGSVNTSRLIDHLLFTRCFRQGRGSLRRK